MANKLQHVLFLSLAVWAVTSCSGGSQQQQQQQSQEPVNGQQQQEDDSLNNASLNGGNPSAAKQGEAMNNAVPSEENFAGANAGASMNNAVPEEGSEGNPFANSNAADPLLNQGVANPTAVPLNQSVPVNAATAGNALLPTNAAPMNAAAPTNAAAVPTTVETPASATAPTANWDKMNASPYANPQMNWPGKGKVKYITRKTTKHASPNGPVVGEYNPGNHPLIYQNGNWVELHDGTYVKGNATSDTPVGYERSLSH